MTTPRFVDISPTFTHDGRYLAFLSRRSFDPIYDEHSFDLTFPASWRPFLVPLAARTPDPFGASPDGRPTSAADEKPDDLHAPEPDDPSAEGSEDVPEPAAEKEKKDSGAPPETVVDLDGLVDRVVPIPVGEGRYRAMGAAKGCLLWFRWPVEGVLGSGRADDEKPDRPVLERYDLVRRKLDVIADPVSAYAVSGDGTRLVVRDGEVLRVLRSDRSGSSAPGEGRRGRVRDRHAPDRRHGRPDRGVAADVRRGGPPDARPLLGRRHGRGRLGRRAGAVPAAGRRGGQPRRPGRRAVGAARRAGDVARLRQRWGRRRLVRAAGPAGCRPGGDRRRVAGRAGAPARDLGARRPQPAGRPRRRRPGRRRDPRGGRAAGRPALGARAAAGRDREPAGRADGAHGSGPRGRGGGAPGRGQAARVGVRAALPGLGGGAAGVRRRPLGGPARATCTCRT